MLLLFVPIIILLREDPLINELSINRGPIHPAERVIGPLEEDPLTNILFIDYNLMHHTEQVPSTRSDDKEKSQSMRNALVPRPSLNPSKRDPLTMLFSDWSNNASMITIAS